MIRLLAQASLSSLSLEAKLILRLCLDLLFQTERKLLKLIVRRLNLGAP